MSWGSINTIGLLLNLAGIIMLFYFGMPFRIQEPPGEAFLTVSVLPNPGQEEALAFHRAMGFVGLALSVVGTMLQIWVSFATIT